MTFLQSLSPLTRQPVQSSAPFAPPSSSLRLRIPPPPAPPSRSYHKILRAALAAPTPARSVPNSALLPTPTFCFHDEQTYTACTPTAPEQLPRALPRPLLALVIVGTWLRWQTSVGVRMARSDATANLVVGFDNIELPEKRTSPHLLCLF